MFYKFRKYILATPIVTTMMMVASTALADLPPGNAITLDDVSGIMGIILRFMIVTSMVMAVIFIVLGGIMTMVSKDSPDLYKGGLARVKNAAIGAAVVLGVGVIINTVAALVDRSFFCQISVLGICLY